MLACRCWCGGVSRRKKTLKLAEALESFWKLLSDIRAKVQPFVPELVTTNGVVAESYFERNSMPSLTTKREVKYTKADQQALEAAHLLQFAVEFDRDIDKEKYSCTTLALLVIYVKQQGKAQVIRTLAGRQR